MDIVILPGDGIGPEISTATLDVLKAADAALQRGGGLTTKKDPGPCARPRA